VENGKVLFIYRYWDRERERGGGGDSADCRDWKRERERGENWL
jgi:hypothetical protein